MAKYRGKNFRERLIQLMEENKVSMTQLSKNTGVPIPTIARMRSDPEANPTIGSLKPIADFFNISVNQLIDNDVLEENLTTIGYIENRGHWTNVPIISWKLAVTWLDSPIDPHKQPILSTDINVSKLTFALELMDDMEDGFRKGAYIIVDPNLTPEDQDYVVAHKKGNREAALKQFRIHDGDSYLKPLNNEFKTVQLDETYQIIGIVRQIKLNLIGKKT